VSNNVFIETAWVADVLCIVAFRKLVVTEGSLNTQSPASIEKISKRTSIKTIIAAVTERSREGSSLRQLQNT